MTYTSTEEKRNDFSYFINKTYLISLPNPQLVLWRLVYTMVDSNTNAKDVAEVENQLGKAEIASGNPTTITITVTITITIIVIRPPCEDVESYRE